jgi:ribosomal protein S18 acetylase RimI-like enzyme
MQNGFVAEAGKRLVGVAAIEVYSKKLAEIQCLAVAEDFHGRGVGKQLVAMCVARAHELGVFRFSPIVRIRFFAPRSEEGALLPHARNVRIAVASPLADTTRPVVSPSRPAFHRE